MRVGIDSYSYHRRYGEVRAGESAAPGAPWPLVPAPVLEHARRLGVDDLFLETCYLPEPETIEAPMLDAGGVRVGFSWGHPWPEGAFHGLDGGRTPAAEDHLARWIAAAARLGHPVMRITLGSPASRGTEPAAVLVERLVAPTRRAAERAAAVGVRLAIENHGDLRAQDVLEVIERTGATNLGVTLDNVNLVRVGDDMLEGTRALASRTLLVQLKDHPPTPDPTVWGGPVSVALGEGVAPLDAILAILADAGFDGPVCVELASLGSGPVDELAMIERSVGWLRAHVPGAASPGGPPMQEARHG
ncbi:MAG: sugar phosphate isomerase/epimerase family protein [Chloroflexota bacterium]